MATKEFTGEKWRAICGWPYEVSSLGRVRRVGKSRGATIGKILGQRIVRRYYSVLLCERARRRYVHVHRLVALAFCGARPPHYQVNHIDGDKRNNSYTNLEWVTPGENTRHAWRVGLCKRLCGEANHSAKLTASDIISIRAMREAGVSQAAIGLAVGCSQTNVGRILRGEMWGHI